jgi:hypothetical protein
VEVVALDLAPLVHTENMNIPILETSVFIVAHRLMGAALQLLQVNTNMNQDMANVVIVVPHHLVAAHQAPLANMNINKSANFKTLPIIEK